MDWKMSHWTLICIAAGANVALNLLLQQGGKSLDTHDLRRLIFSIVMSPWMWLAGLCAVVLLTAFVAAIRQYPLSITYIAVTSMAMVALTVLGALLQYESVSLTRATGLILIVAGLALTAQGS
jgi:multidrug transporter EmrE-like cation transporter